MREYPPALVGLGRTAMARGDTKRASELFGRAHDRSPLVETAWLLAEAREASGDARGAEEAFLRAERDGRRGDRRTLSLMYSTRDVHPEEALAMAEEEAATRGGPYTDDALAWALYRHAKFADARKAIDRARRYGTRDARLLFRSRSNLRGAGRQGVRAEARRRGARAEPEIRRGARGGGERAPFVEVSARQPAVSGAVLLVALCSILVAGPARAHAIGLSRGEYRRTADGLAVELVLAAGEVTTLTDPGRALAAKVQVSEGSLPCPLEFSDALPAEQDGLRVRARYQCQNAAARLVVRLGFLDELSHGHRHAAHLVSGAFTADELCFKQHADFELPKSDGATAVASPTTESRRDQRTSALGFVRMGLEHILSGYDHLIFLFALVLVGGSFRSLLWVVTAFTLAHSLTLTLAVLGVVAPPARLVEPAIALSIAYVGAENLVTRNVAHRWRITFPFGLVHGFGFAGALSQVGLSRTQMPTALPMFNLGVELGQIGTLLVLVPLVARLRQVDWFTRRAVPALSACIVIAGIAWFADRVQPQTTSRKDIPSEHASRRSAGLRPNKVLARRLTWWRSANDRNSAGSGGRHQQTGGPSG